MKTIGRSAFPLLLCTCGLLIHPGGGILSQTLHWSSRGVGGGGSLYSPAINPADNNEFYVGCDMSGLYHTTDFGSSYSLMDFRQIQGGHDSRVQFTQDPRILYCITCANDQALPVRSTDGGKSWSTLPGNPDPSETTYSIAADFNNPDRVIISWYSSILASTDGGKSFTSVHTARNSGSGVTVGGAFFDGNNVYLTIDSYIQAALQQSGGKVFGPSGAAELLNMKPTTLASRIKALGLRRRTDG